MQPLNIPAELRALPQWACANSDKRPFNPISGLPANVGDPGTWVSFSEAITAIEEGRYTFVGFMFNGGIAFVDLDDKPHAPATNDDKIRHDKIIEYLDSYTEISCGGRGRHVLARTAIDLPGRRRGTVEMYVTRRFGILTGDVVGERSVLHERTVQLQSLNSQLVGTGGAAAETELIEVDQIETDEAVITRALDADNGAKFRALWEGRWQETTSHSGERYPSASEADFALLSILCFYSPSDSQVRRLFYTSGLQRPKASRHYIDRALRKIRARMAPLVDLPAYMSTAFPSKPAETSAATIALSPICMPPGMLGELAQHFLASAVMPISEVAIAGALALAGGISGRAFNISGAGLNLYMVLIAPAGSGKEGARDGIEQMLACISQSVPGATRLQGPERAASGQALQRHLTRSPAFISIWDEFGLLFNQMEGPRAPPHLVELKRMLLTCYTRSGAGKALREAIYADVEKDVAVVTSPSMTLLGMTTREHFFDRLSLSNMSEGLLPRISLIEFDGPRPRRNRSAGARPDEALIARCTEIAAVAVENLSSNHVRNVNADPAGQTTLDDFEERCRVLADSDLFGAQVMWSRAAMKASKFAALCAVFDNPASPTISGHHAQWAVDFVTREVELIVAHAKNGTLGAGEHMWEQSIRSAVEAFETMTPKKRRDHRVNEKLCENPYFKVSGKDVLVVPVRILMSYLRQRVPFKGAPQGETRALKDAIKLALQIEVLAPAPAEAKVTFGTATDLFVKGRDW